MKIVNLEMFLQMPEETLFSKYAPHYCEEVRIKGETIVAAGDFFYQDIGSEAIAAQDSGDFGELFGQALREGKSLTMDFDCQSRDGCFDEDQVFAVWEKEDVEKLIARLQTAFEKRYT